MSFIETSLIVAFLGGVGSLLRHLASSWQGRLPWGILAVNSVASFIAGLAISMDGLEIALVAGLAGGLSTFSTFIGQTSDLLEQGKTSRALLNILLNLGITALFFFTALNLP